MKGATTMTREIILRNRLQMAEHNLQCYSANYLCTVPKEGHETEYEETAAEVEMLKVWLKEFHRTNMDSTIEYIGHIGTIQYGRTYDDHPLTDYIEFEVNTGASYLYGDRRIIKVGPEVQDWFVSKDNCCGKYDREKNRSSRLLRITVDHINYIRNIEWAEKDTWAAVDNENSSAE
jgi:hypothetical protein